MRFQEKCRERRGGAFLQVETEPFALTAAARHSPHPYDLLRSPQHLILPQTQLCYSSLENGWSRQKVCELVPPLYPPTWFGSSFKGSGEGQPGEAGRFLPMRVLSGPISPRAQAIVWGLHAPRGTTTLWTSPTHSTWENTEISFQVLNVCSHAPLKHTQSR